MEIEINKLDTDKANANFDPIKEEQQFHTQLQQLLIVPFVEKLQPLLSDIFTQLNFDDQFLKDIRDAKKSKRQSKR